MSQLFEFQKSQLVRALNDTAGELLGALLGLYQAPIDINQGTPLATFTAAIATYTGYAAQAIVWGLPSVNQAGEVEVQGIGLIFRPTDAVAPNSVWGIYITDSTGADLYFAAQFDAPPIPMVSALDQITIVIRYKPATQSFAVVVS